MNCAKLDTSRRILNSTSIREANEQLKQMFFKQIELEKLLVTERKSSYFKVEQKEKMIETLIEKNKILEIDNEKLKIKVDKHEHIMQDLNKKIYIFQTKLNEVKNILLQE
jgi:hypothetical protein